jgi:uncharacterized protein (DUF1330 family)
LLDADPHLFVPRVKLRRVRNADNNLQKERTMDKRYVVLALFAGIAIGAIGSRSLEAQKPPPGYFIGEVLEIKNQAEFDSYANVAPETVKNAGGRYLVRGGKTEALEGEPPHRIVVLAFESFEAARKWYHSPEYEAVKPIRHRSSSGRAFIVEGKP